MTFLPTLRYADVFYGLRTEHLERIEAICDQVVLDQGEAGGMGLEQNI